MIVSEDLQTSEYHTAGTKEFYDTITDCCLINCKSSIEEVDLDNQPNQDYDMLAIGLRDSGVIALVKYDPLVENFEIMAKIRLDLDRGKIVTPYNKLFSYKN